LIIFNELLSNLEELLKEFEALVVDQVVEQEVAVIRFASWCSSKQKARPVLLAHEVSERIQYFYQHVVRRVDPLVVGCL
jgi:hypothetical protein